MSFRKGIERKKHEREGKRRREAKEAGIILEREVKMRKGRPEKRDRGIEGPTVGKFKAGLLHLSKKDVFDIQGRKKTGGKQGRGGRRR
jgi:hypothetical protein